MKNQSLVLVKGMGFFVFEQCVKRGVDLVRKSEKKEDVEAYRHETETRKNIVWTGKSENTPFEVPTVSPHIHERITNNYAQN